MMSRANKTQLIANCLCALAMLCAAAYAGVCAHGKLAAQATRRKFDHCGKCDVGYSLTSEYTCQGYPLHPSRAAAGV